jgi:hypothetical protein
LSARAKERTTPEKRRVQTARVFVVLFLLFLASLSLWQCVERKVTQGNRAALSELLEREVVGSEAPAALEQSGKDLTQSNSYGSDPLALNQAGITLLRTNEKGSILWYQSSWDLSQSRVLLERALVAQGWETLSEQREEIQSFVYAPNAIAMGRTLLASFYPTQEGTSILIELL